MRKEDEKKFDFRNMRKGKNPPVEQTVLTPGNVLIPDRHTAIMTVVASSMAVTVFDPKSESGGICHFIFPVPDQDCRATPVYGLPACVALLTHFENIGSDLEKLKIGLYGGAWPSWANVGQREIARQNANVARDVMKRKGLTIDDEDIGGVRGRKIIFLSATNEIAIVKTELIRRSDWFPESPLGVRNES